MGSLLLSVRVIFSQNEEMNRFLIIEDIEYEGAEKTEEFVFERYLTFHPNDTLNLSSLKETEARLIATDFFKNVEIYTKRGTKRGYLIVVVEVEERKWPKYRFEGGHNDLSGWYFIPVSFRFDNTFGQGKFSSWQVKLGNRISGTSFTYRNPYFWNSKATLSAELFSESQEFVHYLAGYDSMLSVTNEGLRFRIEGNRGFGKHLLYGYRLVRFLPDYDSFLAPYLGDDLRNRSLGIIHAGLQTDTRDNPIYPTKGNWGAITLELAHSFSRSPYFYSKFLLDYRIYTKSSPQNVFAFRITTGFTTSDTPFYERFYLGGSYSQRGYSFAKLTPVGWGTKLFLMQGELRFPLSKNNFPNHTHTAVMFWDIGGIWPPNGTPSFLELEQSIGFGYRVKLPLVGITRFDLAFPISRLYESYLKFHVSFGHTF